MKKIIALVVIGIVFIMSSCGSDAYDYQQDVEGTNEKNGQWFTIIEPNTQDKYSCYITYLGAVSGGGPAMFCVPLEG